MILGVPHICVAADAPVAGESEWDRLAKRLEKPLARTDQSERMMADFVQRQLQPFSVPTSAEAWLADRDRLRNHVLQHLGLQTWLQARLGNAAGQTADLKLTSRGTLDRDGYRIEKLTFESYRGMAVPALLYVPEQNDGRVPGIVSIAGHVYGLGKAADFLQQRNVNLALRGCVVLAYDYMDCGERNTGPDARNGKPYGGGNDHGIRLFSHSLHNPTGLEVLEAMRAIDVLLTRPEVDPERIGFTGESGGGNSTYWVSAIDPRVKLSVPVSCLTSFDYWIRNDRNWDWHQRPWGVRRHADVGQLLALHAPRPLVAISSLRGTDDHEFPWHEAERSFAWAKQVYRLLDAENAAEHYESSTGHGYQEDKRLLLYSAVERWLQPPNPVGSRELEARVESYEDLRCGLPEKNRTYFDIYHEWVDDAPRKNRAGMADDPSSDRAILRDRLGWPVMPPVPRLERIGKTTSGDWEYVEWHCETEPGIVLTLLEIVPPHSKNQRTVVLGRNLRPIRESLETGRRVVLFEGRGAGAIPASGGVVRNWAWFAGRPVSGMHAFDLSQVAKSLRAQATGVSLELIAEPDTSWVALLTAALEPQAWDTIHGPLPFASIHDDIKARGDRSLADVPGLLERIDVPQLNALAAPHRFAK